MGFGTLVRDNVRSSAPYVAASALFLVGLFVHFGKLGDIPSPAGDETNWLGLGLGISRGEDVALKPDAQFVSQTLGHLIAFGFRIFGPSFFAGRFVPAALVVACAAIVLLICFERRAFAMGLTASAFLLLHPWSIAWSRTVSVPYALSLSLMVLTPLVWIRAIEVTRPGARTVAMILAMQLWPLSLHFSPLGAIAGMACLSWTALTARRKLFLSPAFWLAAALAVAHGLPLVLQALGVAKLQHPRSTEVDAEKLANYSAVLSDYLSGESTIRHFTSARMYGADLELLRTIVAVWAVCVAIYLVRHSAVRGRAPLQYGMAGLCIVLSAGAVVGLPIALAGARPWWLPGISADRYGFVLVACLCLSAACAAQISRYGQVLALAGFFLFVAIRTPQMVEATWNGNRADTGTSIENGGGWRGWRITDARKSTVREVWETLDHVVPANQSLTVLAHGFGFQALCFETLIRNNPKNVCRKATKSWTNIPKEHYVALAVWHDDAFARNYSPKGVMQTNQSLRRRFLSRYPQIEHQQTFREPNGEALFDLYVAAPLTQME